MSGAENMKKMKSIATISIIVAALTTVLSIYLIVTFVLFGNGIYTRDTLTYAKEGENTIIVTTPFYIPILDLREYQMDHFEVEQWFLERVNYHRDNYGVHPYTLYGPAVVTSIEHSLDMRTHRFSGNDASDGRTHRERHDVRFGHGRTLVTSTFSSSQQVEGKVTRDFVHYFVDRLFEDEARHEFLMNPTYYYIGFGFSVDARGLGFLCVTMASPHGERAAHHARTPEEREAHRLEYLERVRRERGWTPQ